MHARFIPAGAGNGLGDAGAGRVQAVHPRGRGERALVAGKGHASAGSSPRARGTDLWRRRLSPGRRFIPAGAGNGPPARPRLNAPPVHPRGRGERGSIEIGQVRRNGSSPRARGTDDATKRWAGEIRFIPAGAGNGPGHRTGLGSDAVHPRGRGERCGSRLAGVRPGGSSPRARGTGSRRCPRWPGWRFIPAGAGNGWTCCAPTYRRSVHPRGRGERVAAVAAVVTLVGSSPRARGTVHECNEGPSRKRFIPAGAGNGRHDAV